MADFDIFNGDADGLCALQQLQLAEPRAARLVTGSKRDIALLDRVDAGPGDRLRVLDISMLRNRRALDRLLAAGASIDYIDHHTAGVPPRHANLRCHIDTSPQACTAIIVDRLLGGRWRRWAVTAAFGDGMPASAQRLASTLAPTEAISATDLARLRRLGEALNYNAYAADTGTALIDAGTLFRRLEGMTDPLPLAADPLIGQLTKMMDDDLQSCLGDKPLLSGKGYVAWMLPATPAGRRARGLVAHRLQEQDPTLASFVLAPDGKGRVDVSLRCNSRAGLDAASFAARFGGGGRANAAGIDALPDTRIDALLAAIRETFGTPAACDPEPERPSEDGGPE